MPTECSVKPMGFAPVDGRAVVADFDGGAITSNAGGLLLGATDRAIGLIGRFAACFGEAGGQKALSEWREGADFLPVSKAPPYNPSGINKKQNPIPKRRDGIIPKSGMG